MDVIDVSFKTNSNNLIIKFHLRFLLFLSTFHMLSRKTITYKVSYLMLIIHSAGKIEAGNI